MDKDYSSADSSFIFISLIGILTRYRFDNENNLNNILMGFRRKIQRAQMLQRSDVYGTDIFNDGITMSTREVSGCRDKICGKFDMPKLKCDCPQYEADAESTDVK